MRRFAAQQANAGYLFERTRESLGRLYAMHWPFLQPETARGLRRVPLYERLAAAGACFGESSRLGARRLVRRPGRRGAKFGAKSGVEAGAPPGAEPVYRYSYGRQNWFDAAAEEHRAAREAVALFDLSSFAKFRVQGPGALPGCSASASADLDRPPGASPTPACSTGAAAIEPTPPSRAWRRELSGRRADRHADQDLPRLLRHGERATPW